MNEVFSHPMRESTQVINSVVLADKALPGARNMRNRTGVHRNTSFSVFYRQNKEIVRRAGIILLVILLSNLITKAQTTKKVEERLKAQYQHELQAELYAARQEIENSVRETYGADEIDEQTAHFNREVQMISKLLYPYIINVTDNSLRSGVWCVLSRVQSKLYPDSIEEVVMQDKQWMGYSEDNPVVQRVSDIVEEQLNLYYSGNAYPMNPVYVFMDWQKGELVLRDAYNGKYHIWDDTDWEALGYQ